MTVSRILVAAAALWLCAGCGGEATVAPQPAAPHPVPPPSPAVPGPEIDGAPVVAFLGDSLTAGLGVETTEAFPARVGELFAAAGRPMRIVNAGVSGDTTAGGLRRLDWILAQKPDLIVVALGANDGLRGLSPGETEANLGLILSGIRDAGCAVVLAGMKLPPNYGADFAAEFEAVFERLARDQEAPLIPFLLAGVAGRPELNQADGIHPNPEGHRRIAVTVEPHVAAALQ